MGEYDTLSTNEPYPHVDKKVESIFVHPGYDPHGTTTKGYDIALIKLTGPSLSFYSHLILSLSKFYPDKIRIRSG